MSRRSWITLLLCTALVVIFAPSCGPEWISPTFDSQTSAVQEKIYFELRVPRVVLGFLVGAVLAISGVVFQGMFRNVLASPFTLGISGGAAVGAALSFYLALPIAVLGMRASATMALMGAFLTGVLVWGFARRRHATALTILLSGVVLSFIFSSFIMLLQYLGDFGEVFRMTHWMLGTLEVVGFSDLLAMLPFITAGAAFLFYDVGALNLLSLGDEYAQSRGVAVKSTQLRIILGVSLITGGVVSICGPIGFVGIIVPFLCRLIIGFEHRRLLPVSFFVGGMFLVVCDTISRTLFAPLELPVGICTALVGGPIFLWMLLRSGLPHGSDASS